MKQGFLVSPAANCPARRMAGLALAILLAIAAVDVKAADERPEFLKGPADRWVADVAIKQRLGEALPLDVQLVDEAGQSVPLRTYFQDRPVLLAFVYYQCPMLCTQVLNGVLKAVNAMEFTAGQEFEIVVISFDPSETPQLAADKKRAYLKRYHRQGAEQGWHFLTGDSSTIKTVTEAAGFHYRYDPKTKQYAHASGIMVATPDGRLARYYYGIDYSPRDLRLGLVEAAEKRIGSPVDQVLLLCFHYDPSTGKYTLAVMQLVRAAGAVTVLMIGGFIVVSLRRDRRRTNAISTVESGENG